MLWRESYLPYGDKRLGPAANRDKLGFTGHIDDAATGLTYMQARYYDPVLGRFLANDPVGFSPQRPDMFNRYAYAANDPVNMIDPDGKCAGPLIIPCGIGVADVVVKTATVLLGLFVVTHEPTTDDVVTSENPNAGEYPDRKSAEDRITGGAEPDWTTKERKGYDNPPTGETADKIFGDIASGEGVEVKHTEGEQGAVDVAILPDGSKVIDRNSKTTDEKQGDRTIETQTRGGKTKVEVRFPKDPPKSR